MKLLRVAGWFIWLSCLAFPAVAQLPVQVRESFSPPLSHWLWPANADTSLSENGLTLSHQDPTDQTLLLRECLIRQDDDYRVAMQFLPVGQGISYSMGLAMSVSRDRSSYLLCLIRADGMYGVKLVQNGEESWPIPWTQSRRVKWKDDPVLWEAERRGRMLYLLIDGKELDHFVAPPQMGKYHGIALLGAGKMLIREFAIYRDEHVITSATGRFYNPIKRPLDSTINLPNLDETAPMLGPDRQSLYFSRGKTGDLSGAALFRSRVQGDSMWGPPGLVFPEFFPGRSEVWRIRENRLDWVQCGDSEPADLMQATGHDTLWQNPNRLAGLPASPTGMVSLWQSKNGEILVFSAVRERGSGGQDLYVCFKSGSGWSSPKNLGPDINTFEEEFSPWLSEDGQTLFFASGGHPGYGGWDLYRSERLTQTWTRWSTPENLGPRVNTRLDEGWYFPWKEDRAYMAGQDTVRGDWDLYGLRLPLDPAERPVVRLRGRIINQKTNEALAGELVLRAITGDSLFRSLKVPEPFLGYRALVGYQRAYQLYGISPGYFPLTDTLDLRAVETFRDVRKDVFVVPVEVGETIRLDKVYFVRASPELKEESYSELDRLVALMRAIPTLEIAIHGHTDNIGEPGELQILSEMRAEAVQWYLVNHGIAESRLQAVGFGDTRPVADNRNPETRPLNRRVEFVILKR